MKVRALASLFVLRCVLGGSIAAAETEARIANGPAPLVDDSTPAAAPAPAPLLLRRSYALTAIESVGVLAGMNIGAQLIGKHYAKISFKSIATNFRTDWAWDEDAFTTNNFGHPYQGTLYYQTARTNGLGLLGSAIVTYLDSFVWELVMETEIPSLNDQIVTPAAGILLGEALHRWSRAIRYTPTGERPGALRTVFSTLLEPLGTVNRLAFGEAWRLTPPPPSFGFVAAGFDGLAVTFDEGNGSKVLARTNLIHGALAYTYGLPASPEYTPRGPFDHFDARVEGAVSPDEYFASLRLRTLLYGWSYCAGSRLRGVWGAFGAYDFENPERVRISAAAVGVGTTLHLDIGERGFLQSTGTVNFIPYGSAGGDVPGNSDRDYHRGPGSSQLLEVRLGYAGLGLFRLTGAAYEIDGARFQEGSEILTLTRLEALWGFAEHHAIGVGADFGTRRARFPDMPALTDRSAHVSVFYALIQDRAFGGHRR